MPAKHHTAAVREIVLQLVRGIGLLTAFAVLIFQPPRWLPHDQHGNPRIRRHSDTAAEPWELAADR